MQISKSITMNLETWNEIDKLKGDVSRSKFIENIIKSELKTKKYLKKGELN
jgi:metal-responsive CopG/Arc/MetJ family transcriptional regulator